MGVEQSFVQHHFRSIIFVGPHWCISNGFNWVPFQREIDIAQCTPLLEEKTTTNVHHQVKMFGVVVAIFMVCWAPYHIYFIVSYHFPHIARKEWISNVYLAVRPSINTLLTESAHYLLFLCLPVGDNSSRPPFLAQKRALKKAPTQRWIWIWVYRGIWRGSEAI